MQSAHSTGFFGAMNLGFFFPTVSGKLYVVDCAVWAGPISVATHMVGPPWGPPPVVPPDLTKGLDTVTPDEAGHIMSVFKADGSVGVFHIVSNASFTWYGCDFTRMD
jgi:hypothetical protein